MSAASEQWTAAPAPIELVETNTGAAYGVHGTGPAFRLIAHDDGAASRTIDAERLATGVATGEYYVRGRDAHRDLQDRLAEHISGRVRA